MSDEKDYEGIGRYHDAMEKVASLSAMRHNAAAVMMRTLKDSTIDHTGDTIKRLDANQLQEQIEEMTKINRALEEAIAIADEYCEAAGKKKIWRGA